MRPHDCLRARDSKPRNQTTSELIITPLTQDPGQQQARHGSPAQLDGAAGREREQPARPCLSLSARCDELSRAARCPSPFHHSRALLPHPLALSLFDILPRWQAICRGLLHPTASSPAVIHIVTLTNGGCPCQGQWAHHEHHARQHEWGKHARKLAAATRLALGVMSSVSLVLQQLSIG